MFTAMLSPPTKAHSAAGVLPDFLARHPHVQSIRCLHHRVVPAGGCTWMVGWAMEPTRVS